MGLDTSHNCWHGGYIGFGLWRTALAKCAGIPLGLMEGHFEWEISDEDASDALGAKALNGASMAWLWALARGAAGNVPIKWESLKPDVLHVLLHHSDCDGEIEAKYCLPLACRLEELLPLLPLDSERPWRAKTQQFIDGLRLAGANNEAVDFH